MPADNFSASLHSVEGGSDKIYNVAVVPSGSGYHVNFEYGRRGSALKAGQKTASPVDIAAATKIAEKLVAEKVAKGYRPIGTVSNIVIEAPEDTGVRGQPLMDVDPSRIKDLINSSRFMAQEKHDGERRLVIFTKDGEIYGANKRGIKVPVSEPMKVVMTKLFLPGTILDGEQMGDEFIAFDMLEFNGRSLRKQGFIDRIERLQKAVNDYAEMRNDRPLFPGVFRVTETVRDAADKIKMINRVKQSNGEGVVFKDMHGIWSDARSDEQTRYKFWFSLSAIVGDKTPGKSSVQILLVGRDGSMLDVGKVTIPTGTPIPNPGTVIEVRYRIAYENGSLYIPTFLGVRSDVTPAECLESQRVYHSSPVNIDGVTSESVDHTSDSDDAPTM